MDPAKLNNDATSTIRGTLYQFYIAVEKCFELLEGESVLIEKDGDISTVNAQIEVKQYENDLTDSHLNLWNTLNNWLSEAFDNTKYKYLILLTTQKIGVNAKLKEWNIKSEDDKLKILTEIFASAKTRVSKKKSNQESQSFVLMNSVLDSSQSDKLKEILKKFTILDSSPIDEKYYEEIKQRHCKGVLHKNTFLWSVLGFILDPKTVSKNNWEISYSEFDSVIIELKNKYCSETKIFPSKYTLYKETEDEKNEGEKHLFCKKIEEIKYEEAKPKAISDFVRTQKTILTELGSRIALKSTLEQYEQAILDIFQPAYSKSSRNTSENSIVRDSQNFYDDIIGQDSPQLGNYNNTPPYFKNGTIHTLANDEEKNLKWKLELKDNGQGIK